MAGTYLAPTLFPSTDPLKRWDDYDDFIENIYEQYEGGTAFTNPYGLYKDQPPEAKKIFDACLALWNGTKWDQTTQSFIEISGNDREAVKMSYLYDGSYMNENLLKKNIGFTEVVDYLFLGDPDGSKRPSGLGHWFMRVLDSSTKAVVINVSEKNETIKKAIDDPVVGGGGTFPTGPQITA
jgi:hypothetical protein